MASPETPVFQDPITDVDLSTKKAVFGQYKVISIPWIVGSIIWAILIIYLFRNHLDELGDAWIILFLPLLLFGIWWAKLKDKVHGAFMRQFAERNGFQYSAKGDYSNARGLVFAFGNKNSKELTNEITGPVDDYPIKISNYSATTSSGKNSHDYFFTLFEVSGQNDLPQLFLNSKKAAFMSGPDSLLELDKDSILKLEGDFNKYFDLYVPPQYEQEALEIFTPDVMAELIDTSQKYDLEIVGRQVRIIASTYIYNAAELEAMFLHARHLIDLLDKALSKFSFQVIGNFSPQLKVKKYLFGMNRAQSISTLLWLAMVIGLLWLMVYTA